MEIEGGAEDVAFQEQAITDDGPDQESTAACVTHGKNASFKAWQNSSICTVRLFFH